MSVLKTLVEPTTKARFRSMAKARGLSESELLRAVILTVTGEDDTGEPPIAPDSQNADSARLTVRMPRFLMEAAAARAKANGMATSRWIAAMVQSNLTRQPVMTDAELAGLLTANRELAAIGRNINQIARALNLSGYILRRLRRFRATVPKEPLSEAANTPRLAAGKFIEAFHETERVKLEHLAQLREMVTRQRSTIRALVRSSQNAWGVDDAID